MHRNVLPQGRARASPIVRLTINEVDKLVQMIEIPINRRALENKGNSPVALEVAIQRQSNVTQAAKQGHFTA